MKILLLEDNKFDADLIIRYIIRQIKTASIQHVNTITEAKDLIAKVKDFSVVLLDLNLPDGNGIEVLIEMQRIKLDVLTIVLTSVTDEEQAVLALKTGADDYFVKGTENFSKLPDILLHNISTRKNRKTISVLDILYLEYEPTVANSTIDYFAKHAPQLKIELCNKKESVLEKLQLKTSEKRKYQAFIMDYELTNIDSLDIIKKIRQEHNIDIPIIILTCHGNEQIAIQALKLGADEYIVKRENYLIRLPSLIENAYKYYLLNSQKRLIENSEKSYRLLAENAGDVIFTLDANFDFTYISPSVKNLQGFSPEEIVNQNIKKYLSNESLERIKKCYEKLLYIFHNISTYSPTVVELEMYKLDNTKIWTEVKISLLLNEKNECYGILGVTRDITIRKRYEQELIAAKEKAEENDRLKSAFLANISHEIRTPMNGILGFSELLRSKELDSRTINLYINAIETSGNRMLNTLNDLMDISKIEAGLIEIKFSEFNLNKVLEHHYFFFKPEADKKGIELKYELKNKNIAFFINTDKIKLDAIIGNLIKNSLKYTEKGNIEFGYYAKENILEFFVRDTGIGIEKKSQDKIFDRFVQANQDYTKQREGSGLGLSIAKSYVHALGGKIWVESELNHGASFYFTIPYIIKSKKLSHKQLSNTNLSPKNESIKYKEKALLIVDDDEVSRELLFEIFKNNFGNIKCVDNGYKAIDVYTKEKIDVIILDIKMPGISGFETSREIRKKDKNVIIIAQSAFISLSERKEAELSGCDAYFTKPIVKKELFDFIDKKVAHLSHKD